jgi:hypothetical protein
MRGSAWVRLRPRYRTGILSNSFAGAREREQAVYGFEDLVEEIIYSHECGMSKPDPGIYALACERLRVEPAQMVFLDDHQPCVEGARQAGIHAVLYQDNSQAVSDIEDLLAAIGGRYRDRLVPPRPDPGIQPSWARGPPRACQRNQAHGGSCGYGGPVAREISRGCAAPAAP